MNAHPKPYTVATFTPNFKQGEEVWFFHVGPNDDPILVRGYIHQPTLPSTFGIPKAPRFKGEACQLALNVNWIVTENKEQAMERYASCEVYVRSEDRLYRSKGEALASLNP